MGTTVGESLVDQICYYQELLSKTTDEQDIAKINSLIDGTKNILDMYQSIAVQNGVKAVDNQFKPGNTVQDYASIYALAATAVPAAIAWFNASNYLLSAELLTHAWIENFVPGDYSPVHGNRVVGSQVTYTYINSNLLNTSISYNIYAPDINNSATCYEEDLGFALHSVNASRSSSSSTKIHIEDPYDFDVKTEYNEVLAALIRVFEYAQAFKIIGEYKVVIDVDVADSLYLKLNSTTNGVHSVSVHNLSNKQMEIAYNTKMCLPNDAKAFQGINNIEFMTIPANGFRIVNISENALASHITFCYIKDGYKIITYADELYLNRNILNFTFNKTVIPASDIALITKKGGDWLIQLTNTYGSNMRVDYNSKMCNESDAKNWTGLKDITSFNLSSGESKFIYISENYFATHIALRFVSSTYEYYIYANKLNLNGTMSIGRRNEYLYSYLTLQNNGKTSKKWKIKIINPLNSNITVYYNDKMCNYNDAKNWTGLKNIVSIYIPANSSRVVEISENWFATSIAVSYNFNGYRLISYADGLSTNGTINVYTNRV